MILGIKNLKLDFIPSTVKCKYCKVLYTFKIFIINFAEA